MTLPLRTVRTSPTKPQPDSLIAVPKMTGISPTLDGLQVLVVDDEADARELLITVLEQAGAGVVAVASATEAIEAIAVRGAFCRKGRSMVRDQATPTTDADAKDSSEAQKPDILLCDIGMPEEDGYTLIRKVRALKSEQGGQIQAVAITAYAREEDRAQALSARFQLHIPKPIESAKLVTVVASLVEQTSKGRA